MLDNKKEYIKEWLSFAKEDLDTANVLLSGEYLYNRSICYHCQQAAEKI
jgi:HEPN domain-containing protein